MTFVIAGLQLVITRVDPEDQLESIAAQQQTQLLEREIEQARLRALRTAMLQGMPKIG